MSALRQITAYSHQELLQIPNMNSPISPILCLPNLEWEFLYREHSIKNPEIPGDVHLPGTARLLEIQRDDQYALKASITGPHDQNYTTKRKTLLGSFVRPFEIRGTGWNETYELIGCFIGDIHCKFSYSESPTFQVDLHIQRIKKVRENSDSSPSWLTECYLNGVHDAHFLGRSTTRQRTSEYHRERDVYNKRVEIFRGDFDHCLAFDYAYIQCPDFEFIVHKVPEGLGPAWSRSIGIEYREEFGRIPDPSERKAVGEIVGFIMGKHLLNVGYSAFDESGNPLELCAVQPCAVQPWGDNVVSLCQALAFPPIQFPHRTDLFETTLQELVPKYLEAQKDLNLDEVLMRYWIGSTLSVGTDIPIIANGMEILANAWFKSERSKSKGTYLPKEEFSALVEEEFANIADKLGDNSYKDRLLRKMRGANNRGSGERMELFFQELGLNRGTLENKAIKVRNRMIHSRVTTSEREQFEGLIRLTWAYCTLFHRVMLKILGYSGNYLDYTSEDFPLLERAIEEAAG